MSRDTLCTFSCQITARDSTLTLPSFTSCHRLPAIGLVPVRQQEITVYRQDTREQIGQAQPPAELGQQLQTDRVPPIPDQA